MISMRALVSETSYGQAVLGFTFRAGSAPCARPGRGVVPGPTIAAAPELAVPGHRPGDYRPHLH